MKIVLRLIFVSVFFSCYSQDVDVSFQNQKIRDECKEAQELEQKILKLEVQIDTILQKEKISAPVIKNIYEILTRCFTILFDIQRFSQFLALSQCDSKNDFVRCSIVIKNFASYFKLVGSQLLKNSAEMNELRSKKKLSEAELGTHIDKYNNLKINIDKKISELPKKNEEGIMQNFVYHIATKSESIDELDAELESENAVGVLKNAKISTDLSLAYPVCGKLVTEFGDKGQNGEMIYYISFETRPSAIVTSPAKGFVVFAGNFLNYGNMIIISNGDYRIFLYGMESMYTMTGDIVEIGDYVGKMKDSNNNIIKMELRKSGEALDPRHWLLQTLEKDGK